MSRFAVVHFFPFFNCFFCFYMDGLADLHTADIDVFV
jgi:hypothetical protein